MKIGIIGGGLMGLALAHKLSGEGHTIKVFEQEEQVGGLATYQRYRECYWDRFYHVILPCDKDLLAFIDSLGLSDQLRWKKTFTGVYVDKKFYSVSSSKEFLLFPPLNWVQKCRLAFTILYASRVKDWKKMEAMTVSQWLIRVGGRKTYEKFWKPLLLAKLGEAYQRASAVFIWTYIKRLFEARNTNQHQEQMGYVKGGYKTVLDKLMSNFENQKVEVLLSTAVETIRTAGEQGLWVHHGGQKEYFDKVICTTPVNVLQKIAGPSLMKLDKGSQPIEYLGVVCMVLFTQKPLTNFYVLNLADKEIPFTGVIGMSTLVDIEETGGLYMTYLPKYVLSTDPILKKTDQELQDWFLQGLQKLYSGFQPHDVVFSCINRAFKVQPLQVLHYSSIIPKTHTLHPDFYVLNTTQFVNDTLNNNSVCRLVNEFLAENASAFRLKQSNKAALIHN